MKKFGDFWLPGTDSLMRISEQKNINAFQTNGGFQMDHLTEALSHVTERTLAFDGGSHVGSWTKVFAEQFEKVVAVELADDTFECLDRNINEWGFDNVEIYNRALSDVDEMVGYSEVYTKRSIGRRVSGSGNIKSITIDSLNLNALSFLKLDVEGYEAKAIKGGLNTIDKFSPVVLIECKMHLNALYGRETESIELLEDMGYKLITKIGEKKIDWLFSR